MICLKKVISLYLVTLSNLLLASHPSITINNHNTNVAITLPTIREIANDILEMAKKDYQINTNWFENNPKKTVSIGIGSIYLAINSYLVNGRFTMKNSNNWSNWKNDATLGDLLNIPTSQLCHELYQSILDKYNNNNQSDLINPLVCFSKNLDQELNYLKTFCKISAILNKLKINFLFLITNHDLEVAKDKINRLTYFKKVITESLKISLNN